MCMMPDLNEKFGGASRILMTTIDIPLRNLCALVVLIFVYLNFWTGRRNLERERWKNEDNSDFKVRGKDFQIRDYIKSAGGKIAIVVV